MHELSIAQDLTAIVVETAERENLSRVTRVCVTFGQLVSIVPGIFESAFTVAVKDSVAENAELAVEILPVKLRCKNCGNDFLPGKNLFLCAECNSSDIDIIQGKELYVKSIEGE